MAATHMQRADVAAHRRPAIWKGSTEKGFLVCWKRGTGQGLGRCGLVLLQQLCLPLPSPHGSETGGKRPWRKRTSVPTVLSSQQPGAATKALVAEAGPTSPGLWHLEEGVMKLSACAEDLLRLRDKPSSHIL